MSKRKDEEKRRFWQPFIDHLNKAWKEASKKDFNYPFTGKDMADLRYHCGNFGEWGMMALWDVYIETADEYVKKKQFDIFTFTRSLPRLLDSPRFKILSRQYEDKLCGPLDAKLAGVLKQAVPQKLPPKPDKQAQRVKAWAKARALREAQKSLLPGF